MTTLSATDVALEGFRVTRENPRTFLIWSGFSFAVSIVGGLLTITMGDEAREALAVLGGREPPSFDVLIKALETLLPLLGLGMISQSMIGAAVFRIVLRHADHGFGYLKFGMDEVRLLIISLLYFVMATVLVFLLSVPAGALALVLQGVVGTTAALFIGVAIVMLTSAWIGARLCLAPAITFSERRLAVFESWKLTKGNGWRLVGGYTLAFFCYIVIVILGLSILTALAAIGTGGNLEAAGKLLNPDSSSFSNYFTPWTIAYLVFGAPISVLWYCVFASPAALAYRILVHDVRGDSGEVWQ